MGTKIVLLSTLIVTAIGAYGCGRTEQPTLKRSDSSASSKKNAKKKNAKEGVSFNLSLPEEFEENTEDPMIVKDSAMAKEFAESSQSKFISMTCDDDVAVDFETVKDEKLRGILKISLTQIASDQTQKEGKIQLLESTENSQAKDLKGKDQQGKDQQGKDQLAKDQLAKDQLAKDQLAKDQQGKDQQGKDQKDIAALCKSSKDEKQCINDMLKDLSDKSEKESNDADFKEVDLSKDIDVVAIPFVCSGSAKVQIDNLENSNKYMVKASLFSDVGNLKFTGETESFDAETGDLKLLMEQQKEAKDVNIEVVFGEQKKKN
jgi:hypothetical protein